MVNFFILHYVLALLPLYFEWTQTLRFKKSLYANIFGWLCCAALLVCVLYSASRSSVSGRLLTWLAPFACGQGLVGDLALVHLASRVDCGLCLCLAVSLGARCARAHANARAHTGGEQSQLYHVAAAQGTTAVIGAVLQICADSGHAPDGHGPRFSVSGPCQRRQAPALQHPQSVPLLRAKTKIHHGAGREAHATARGGEQGQQCWYGGGKSGGVGGRACDDKRRRAKAEPVALAAPSLTRATLADQQGFSSEAW